MIYQPLILQAILPARSFVRFALAFFNTSLGRWIRHPAFTPTESTCLPEFKRRSLALFASILLLWFPIVIVAMRRHALQAWSQASWFIIDIQITVIGALII